ncbi:hypothetical protein H2248_005740 [Termitomyces sp. 'cryptogamus']|nr:hypothetical protein H2248_005740 [Termitomyces sp. 'cryptogamus']
MIPKPTNTELAKYPLFKLRMIHQWSKDQLKALREAVCSASEKHLDVDRVPKQQDSVKWKKFKDQVVKKCPELEGFRDHWPIYIFLRMQRKVMRQRERRRMKSKTPDRHNRHVSSTFVGKPLPRRIRLERGKTVATIVGHPVAEKVLAHISVQPTSGSSTAQPGPSHLLAQVPQLHTDRDNVQVMYRSESHAGLIGNDLRERFTQLSSGLSHKLIQAPWPIQRTGRDSKQVMRWPEASTKLIGNGSRERLRSNHTGYVACLFCDFLPVIPAGAKSEIERFSQTKSITDVLTCLGIVNDKHLYILNLLTTWNAGPKEFLGSLGEGMLKPLYKFSLLEKFQKYDLSETLGSSYQDISCWSGCPNHPQGNKEAPRKLQRLLEKFGMEELVPVFSAAHVKSDDEYDLLCGLDEVQRSVIFNGGQFRHVRPFQRWMIDFLLAHRDILLD